MSFQNNPKFKRPNFDPTQEETPEEIMEILMAHWCDVMRQLGYITVDQPTEDDRLEAVKLAEADGIIVVVRKRIYNGPEMIYDIVIQQLAAEVVFERGDAEDSPLQ